MSKVNQTLAAYEATHGPYEQQAAFAQALKRTLRQQGQNWNSLDSAQQESLEMICVKISRILNGNHKEKDHWHDIAGYAVLVEAHL